jgi:6-phosphogluconolactonase (cycloisomerase 2 family)
MKKLFWLPVIAFAFTNCTKDENINNSTSYSGYIYTSTNSSTGNGIIALGTNRDGTLKELPNSPYTTGANGDAAEGDFDTQWALRIVGDYLLAVNAGNNPVNGSVSVFRINRTDGSLSQVDQNPSTPAMDNIDSRGVRAASIAAKDIGGISYVVVANQHSNPNFQMPTGMAVGAVASSPLRNLAVFTFNKSTGVLEFKNIGATYIDGSNGGPTTVEFNSTGTKIAVSTWGVPHFMVPEPDLTKQKPGRLYVYNFSAGTLSQTGMYEEVGVSGNIGLSWSPADQYVYLSNFNIHSTKEANSVTVHDGATAAKVQNFASGGRNDEACWTWVTNDRSKLLVASFGENVVSVFDIGSDNKLKVSLSPNFFVRRGGLPMGDTKDLHQSGDGNLYVVGAYQSHTVSTFKVSPNGTLSEVTNSPYAIPSSAGKTKDQHAFLGLTGFDK